MKGFSYRLAFLLAMLTCSGCQKCFLRQPLPEFITRPLSVGTGSSTWILVDSASNDTLIAKLADLGPTTRPLVTPVEEICYSKGILLQTTDLDFPTSSIQYVLKSIKNEEKYTIRIDIQEHYNGKSKNNPQTIELTIFIDRFGTNSFQRVESFLIRVDFEPNSYNLSKKDSNSFIIDDNKIVFFKN
jgi:hypothetical protein